jgi:hypothetical protein
MNDRRSDTRILCADLIDVKWTSDSGRRRHAVATLDDISEAGACVLLDEGIPEATRVVMSCREGEFAGAVRHCEPGPLGYLVGLEFDADSHWDPEVYEPRHLLDPRTVEGPPRRAC